MQAAATQGLHVMVRHDRVPAVVVTHPDVQPAAGGDATANRGLLRPCSTALVTNSLSSTNATSTTLGAVPSAWHTTTRCRRPARGAA